MTRSKRSTEPETGSERHGAAPLLLLGIPLAYVILVGPAVRYFDDFPGPVQDTLEVIYSPLEWLDSHIPGNPIDRYIDLWD